MSFFDYVTLVGMLLQREGRLTYRALQREFGFDAAYLDRLRRELIFRRIARDEQGEGLVWTGVMPLAEPPTPRPSAKLSSAAPALPPLHLAAATPPTDPIQAAMPADSPAVPLPDEAITDPVSTLNRPKAERRQLTVMFCNFVGSAALARQLDLEDLRAVVQSYQEAASEAIRHYQGYIAQYLGDGLMVYFGYPTAHENDVQRAVHTGLEIVSIIVALNTRLEDGYQTQLAVRIGIHTGPVVVGQMGGGAWHEQLALGETPNIAARLQGLAAPNTVIISNVTARLVGTSFVLESLGLQALRGVADPMQVWRVDRAYDSADADEAVVDNGGLQLVGRDEEIGLLRRRWEQSKEGLGQVVLVTGEAGIGKSCLLNVIRTHVAREGFPRVTLRCSPYHQHSALYPVIEQIYAGLKIERDAPPEVQLTKLEQGLQRYRFASGEVISLFAQLLSIPLPEGRYPPLTGTSQQQRQRTLDTLVAWQLEEAERQQLLVLWEDLHWADPSTLDFLGLLMDQAPTVALLSVLTFRPEFVPPWPMRSHMTSITLNRLERSQVEALLTHLTVGKRLPSEVVQHIVTKTDGVPLYVEELTKTVLESDILQEEADRYTLRGLLSDVTIPATLHDSLMARLDRFPAVREVAQLGAVIGREFSYEMLWALAELAKVAEATLRDGLAKLVATELLYQRGRPPRAKYVFKHALIRDAAYQSLLRRTRQEYHEQVAELWRTHFPELVEAEPEVVAHHFTEAGCVESALTFWHRAGQRAIERSANLEAIGHLSRGLDVLDAMADPSAYIEQELRLQTTLGPALMAAKGYGAAEVERSYVRARELCEQIGETRQLFQVMLGLWNVYLVRAELKQARDLAEQCLSLGQRLQDPARLHQAYYALGNTLFHSGEFSAACDYLKRSMALYEPQRQHAHAVQNTGVVCLSYLAWTLWYLGYPEQALQKNREALNLAEELTHPYSLAFALNFSAWLHQFRRDREAAHNEIRAAIAVSKQQAFPLWLAMATPLEGWALVEEGQSEKGFAQLRQGMADFRATGAAVFWPNILALLAESHAKVGQAETGLSVLEEALTATRQNGECVYEAALHRLKGELWLQQVVPDEQQAETCFHKALAVARLQQAKALELRAAMSLSRLWYLQGKCEDAHDLLAPVYDWFTEGFDMADLLEAKALLDMFEQ
jgi:predicted ATPase/class 3 adenylate cyclase